ncbi:hypothetical protein CSC70_12305 [Pseudoxanthomonas kalamensis DSM 18571]|uniref:hypothetical protein n=1 Tax=Pseudoxanthomonas kalamensis TaxID=289483 RepID=UPI001391A84A|nr:hypothetical protein [Pseudoxanthomonas kalamensis]KAF1708877.1 hypothetical protein CSC70_12305 [Pseudoxanthomonas kalamensis DSM 18571]
MANTYTIEPIREECEDDPVMRMVEDVWLTLHGEPLAPLPPRVIGWRLVMLRDGEEVAQREFTGGDEAYAEAQAAGGAWLRQHGGSHTDTFVAHALQTFQRMAWDHDYRYRISQRGF